MTNKSSEINRLRAFIFVVVTIIWAVVALASIITHEYQPLMIVSGLMGAVVGYATGLHVVLKKNGNGDNL